MSTLQSTILVNGKEVEDGSPEMVKLVSDLLFESAEALNQASGLIGRCPDVVSNGWRKEHRRVTGALDRLRGKVGRFGNDYAKRGLESAVKDASFRGELE